MKTLRDIFTGSRMSLREVTAGLLSIAMTFMFLAPSLVMASSVAGDKVKDDKLTAEESDAKLKAALKNEFRNQDDRKEFTPEELEQMRSALLDLLEIGREVHVLRLDLNEKDGGSAGQSRFEEYESARENIQKLGYKELNVLRTALNPVKMMARTSKLRASFASYQMRAGITVPAASSAIDGFPEEAPFCPPPTTQEYKDAKIALMAAEATRDIAQNGCNEVIVAVGFGGNARLACLATDAVFVALKVELFDTIFCYDDYTGVLAGANYARLGHIHDDIAAVGSSNTENFNNVLGSISTNATTITTAITDAKTEIVNNDNSNRDTIVNSSTQNTTTITTAVTDARSSIIENDNTNTTTLNSAITNTKNELNTSITNAKTDILTNAQTNTQNILNNADTNTASIVNNDNANRATIISNANANTTTLLNNGNTNSGNIIANDNQNAAMLNTAITNAKNEILANANANNAAMTLLTLRTGIETDLAQPDNATYVALYVTPTSNGGHLDLVREIVAETITKLAGTRTAQANAFLAEADAQKAAGDWKSAYQSYRKAYKTAVG